MKKNRFKILIVFFCIVITIIILFAIYVYKDNYKASDEVKNYLNSTDIVKVSKIDYGYFFDGNGEKDAIIFYPGGKVEYTAYSRIMYELAKNGIDTFLIKMPFNLAIFDIEKANNIIDEFKYDNYYISGHSLGGVMASIFATKNLNKVKGVITLSAYPSKKLPSDILYISIYGTEDLILNMNNYNDSRQNWPNNSKEFIIEGGNHSNFGNYGFQKGDGKASITNNEQQDYVVNIIVDNIGR